MSNMTLNDSLVSEIERVLSERFKNETVESITIDSVVIDEDESVIRIQFTVETEKSPKMLADQYFGLTNRVRKALGDDWRNFFPVITPRITHGARA